MKFVVDKTALVQVYVPVSVVFYCKSPFHHVSPHLEVYVIPGQAAHYHILGLKVWGFNRHLVRYKAKKLRFSPFNKIVYFCREENDNFI
jgi:hypothetical protein